MVPNGNVLALKYAFKIKGFRCMFSNKCRRFLRHRCRNENTAVLATHVFTYASCVSYVQTAVGMLTRAMGLKPGIA